MDSLLQDVKFGFRSLSRNPLLVCATVLALTLGIGLNTGVFTLINASFLRPWVEKDPHSFIRLYGYNLSPSFNFGQPGSISLDDYRAYVAEAHSVSELAAWHQINPILGGAEVKIRALLVSCNFFSVYGLAKPSQGRLFLADECAGSNSDPVAVISDELWRTQLNADPRILGHVIFLNRHPFTVVGITPPHFSGRMNRANVWIPYLYSPESQLESESTPDFLQKTDVQWLAVTGHRKPNYSIHAVQSELAVIARQQDLLHPGRNTALFVTGGSAFEEPGYRGRNIVVLLLLMGSLTLLLLIACANVATLLLSRAASRRQEIAIRVSLGASRTRLARLLLTESLLLAAPAGAISVYLAYSIPTFFSLHMMREPVGWSMKPDALVFAYLAGATLFAAFLGGLAPLLESAKADHLASLNGQEGLLGPRRGHWLSRNPLIGAQVAMSMVFMVGAGIQLHSYDLILNADPGFETRQVMVVPLNATTPRYTDASAWSFFRTLAQRAQALPGVESVCYTDAAPFEGSKIEEFRLPGQRRGTGHIALVTTISPDFFETLRIPIIRGRAFHDQEMNAETPAPVVVVSQAFATSFWPQQDPIDKLVLGADGVLLQVVGVARDTRSEHFGVVDGARIYRLQTLGSLANSLMIRFRGDPGPEMLTVKHLIENLDPELPAVPRTLLSLIEENASLSWTTVELVLVLAAGAILLALTGIYAVVRFSVNQRTKEIGVRMALGATKRDVVWLILRSNMRPVFTGLAAGLVLAVIGSIGMTRVAADDPLGTQSPVVFLVAALLLQIAAIGAMLGPALRVAREDPARSLRDQ